MNTVFLFVIPLTPQSMLTPMRKALQKLCFETLLTQNYTNWKAIILGSHKPSHCNDNRFIFIEEEGPKELKLQMATKYIRDHKVACDYIIRLDDDDIINPSILEKYKNTNADAVVDLYHWFIEWDSKLVSKEFRPWFPNTFMQKREHALSPYGVLSKTNVAAINEFVSLIETNHALMHHYYSNKNVLFNAANPIYLRVLNRDSITSNDGKVYEQYLSEYGDWDEKIPNNFPFIDDIGSSITISKKKTYKRVKNMLYLKIIKNRFLANFNTTISN